MLVVFLEVDCCVRVNVAFRKHGGESESVVAVNEVVIYVIDLRGDVVKMDDGR